MLLNTPVPEKIYVFLPKKKKELGWWMYMLRQSLGSCLQGDAPDMV